MAILPQKTVVFSNRQQTVSTAAAALADHIAATDPHAGYVLESLFDAYTMIYADSDNTPAALTVGASTFVGRKSAGGIVAMSASDARTILNVEDGATKYPDTGEQAFTDADHSKLDGIEANATKYPDTGEQAFTDADHSKLDAIEASADVTDAGNVASTIHGVDGKAAIVGADEFAVIDTEASNVLKKITLTELEAVLKTYFDTVYSPLGHTH